MFIETLTEKKLTIDGFINAVKDYHNLDAALTELPSEYLEFFMNNEKRLKKAISRLFESSESPGYVGWTPPEEKIIKMVKYKGQLIKMEYYPEQRVWDTTVVFRNITAALKFGKKGADDITL